MASDFAGSDWSEGPVETRPRSESTSEWEREPLMLKTKLFGHLDRGSVKLNEF